VFCGLYDQHSRLVDRPPFEISIDTGDLMNVAMLKNLSLIGNCIGTTADLARAVADFEAGRLDVIVDSVFEGHDVGAFLDRTYNARDRFGKVVYRYD
jgi:hypothetical protein